MIEDAETYNETNRALIRSRAAPLITNGPISRCRLRLTLESSALLLSSSAKDASSSTLLGSAWRRLVGVCSDMVDVNEGGGGRVEAIVPRLYLLSLSLENTHNENAFILPGQGPRVLFEFTGIFFAP